MPRSITQNVAEARNVVKATYGGTESFSAAHAYAQQAWQEWLRITAEGACIKGMQDRNFK